jgi:hypothetical protein
MEERRVEVGVPPVEERMVGISRMDARPAFSGKG